MKSFLKLYQETLKQEVKGEPISITDYDEEQLDCLLHPQNYPPVIRVEDCKECDQESPCRKSCIFDAIQETEDGLKINKELCMGCAACIEACERGKIVESKDALAAMRAVHNKKKGAYALVAPAFFGQFGEDITPGKLRSAFKELGFDGMIEVALFADLLTLKEALEFDIHVKKEGDYQLTSCCCPVWIAMIRKVYHELMPHVPGAVSPMVACGRVVKKIHPEAVTVFIGPCMAKKSEAREADVKDAVDYVLTFEEVRDIFEAADIKPQELADDKKDHASWAGRMYARTGGVSEAVMETVAKLNPKGIPVKAEQADGVPACRAMIERIKNHETDANFFEGMGCNGGCVGGPKAILDKDTGRRLVEEHAKEAEYQTPMENPHLMELLQTLGFLHIDDLLKEEELFTRHF